MRYLVASEHQHFFQKERYILFDAIVTASQMEVLRQPINRLSTLSDPLTRYLNGRDLFREDATLKAILLSSKWAEIAASLVHERPLRLAYTQYIYGKVPFDENLTLKEISAFTQIPGGLFLDLKTGSGCFLAGDCSLSKIGWLLPDAELLLIAYMGQEARYLFNIQDPCVQKLKQFGYGFGDKLKYETHPFIYI